MKFTVQLVASTDDGQEETVLEVAVLEKEYQRIEQLGLTLTEAKQLLTQLQHQVVEGQTRAFLATRAHCQACGLALAVKEQMTRTLRTLFGTVVLASPRLYHCRCQARLSKPRGGFLSGQNRSHEGNSLNWRMTPHEVHGATRRLGRRRARGSGAGGRGAGEGVS